MFDANEPLEYIHKLDEESSQPGYVVFDNDQGTLFHKTFYNSPLFDEFKMIYKKWIKQVIAPMFKRDLGEDKIIYQKSPTFRISLPNNVAVGQKHCDADYNHPEGEINFWVPLTETFGSNGFYLESEPDKGDFHPFPRTLKPGDVLRFWGNKCKHYNEINTTGQTRVSFDARVIPGSLWKPSSSASVKSNLKFDIGSYFEELRVDDITQ